MRRLFLCLLLLPTLTFAETPPTGSLAANAQWPRLLVTAANRANLLNHIGTYYNSEFQTWLTALGDPPTGSDAEIIVKSPWGPANYAFVAALGAAAIEAYDGPDEGTSPDFTLPESYDTDGEVCDAAYALWANDVTDGSSVCTSGAPCRSGKYFLQNRATVSSERSDSTTVHMQRAISGGEVKAYYPPSAFLFDWCHAELTVSEKQAIADAFYEAYTEYWQGEDLLTTSKTGTTIATTSSSYPAVVDDQLGALTIWGDTDVLDGTKRQTLYDTFYQLYVNRYFWELSLWGNTGHVSYYGADYWSYTVGTLIPPIIASINTALGTEADPSPYASGYKQFTEIGKALSAWMYPEYIGKTSTGCGVGGSSPCVAQSEPWGYNTVGHGLMGCRSVMMSAGFSRFMALTTGISTFTTDANRSRWVLDNFYLNDAGTFNGCATAVNASSPWSTNLYYLFLFGYEGTTATTPTDLSVRQGWDYFIFKSDYTATATQVFVGGQKYATGGHDELNAETFAIRKNGPLFTHKVNVRSGNCLLSGTGTDDYYNWHNAVGVHVGSSDSGIGCRTSSVACGSSHQADFTARGIGGVIYEWAASGSPKYSTSSRYDYVMTDYGPAWTGIASLKQREVTYLRGTTDHEYVITYDRVDVSTTANDPIWQAWVPVQPACVDAACVVARDGKWTTTGKVVSVTNERNALARLDGQWDFPATQGKAFLKSLLPADGQISILGDDGGGDLMYQKPDDDGSVFTSSGCAASHQQLFGWGKIWIKPETPSTTNRFLTVIQIGDSTTLSTMTDSVVAEQLGEGWDIAYLQDSERNRLVSFAQEVGRDSLAYRFRQTTATADHLVVNLKENTPYYVAQQSQEFPFLGLLGFAPALALPWARRKAIPYLALLTMIALLLIQTFPLPVTMTVSVSKIPTLGAVEYHSDAAGVLFFTTER